MWHTCETTMSFIWFPTEYQPSTNIIHLSQYLTKKRHAGTFVIQKLFCWSYSRIMSSQSKKALCSSSSSSSSSGYQSKKARKRKPGLIQQSCCNRLCFGPATTVFLRTRRGDDECPSILSQVDWPGVPYEVDFWRKSFPNKSVVSTCVVFGFCLSVTLSVS